jgi:HEPN domain-containing protein
MFLNSAKGNITRKLYDVACFEADQAVELFLKAYILKFTGTIPRTHGIRTLLGHLISVPKIDKKTINKFASERRSDLIMLEDAYLRSRYSGEAYNRQDARKCIEVAEEVIELVKRVVVNL